MQSPQQSPHYTLSVVQFHRGDITYHGNMFTIIMLELHSQERAVHSTSNTAEATLSGESSPLNIQYY